MMLFNSLSRKEKGFFFVSSFFILYITFPLLEDVTHIPVQFVSIFTVVSLLLLYPQSLKSKAIKWFAFFVVVLFFKAMLGSYFHINGLNNDLPAAYKIIVEIAWILPSLLMVSILMQQNDAQLYRLIGFGSLTLLVLSFLYILPLITAYSNILRTSLHEENLSFARPNGLPDYTLMHAYTFIVPGLCMYVRNKHMKYKLLAVAVLALLFFVITQTAVSTSITLSAFVILFCIIYDAKNKSKSAILIIITVGICYLAYKWGLILSFVDWLMPFFDETAVSFKLQDLHDSIVAGNLQGGSFEGRANHHAMSLNSFWNNPLFGGNIAGGHSNFLDLLGTVGLVGFIPFFMIIWCVMKDFVAEICVKQDKIYIYIVFVIAAIFLYHKGIFGAPGWLFMCVIAPSLVKAISDMSIEREH